MDEAARRAAQSLKALASERQVKIELTIEPRAPAVPHDPDQLQQVLINLIKNGIEASHPDSVLEVTVGSGAPATRGRRVPAATAPSAVVRVSDHGDGISAEHLKTIFEPFFTTKPGGTGLGLYISHDIVKRHGGNLTVHSEPGRGTTFTVELPLEHNGGIS
jgi:signal transduction histidine kinase